MPGAGGEPEQRGPVGILAVQGGVAPHRSALASLGIPTRAVRCVADLDGLHGLVLPGGESTAMLTIMERRGLLAPLHAFGRRGAPVLATCAGLILAAREVRDADRTGCSPPVSSGSARRGFGWLDIAVTRNAYGNQRESFVATSDDARHPLVFIRAPWIETVGQGVAVLATVHGRPVLVRQGSIVGATFHPELADSTAIHAAVFCAARSRACPSDVARRSSRGEPPRSRVPTAPSHPGGG